jgi:putative flippase GtrA
MLVSMIAAAGMRFTGVPKGFPPFTSLPILSGVVGGFLLASVVYAILRLVSSQPDRAFFFAAIIALALSFALPLRLSFTKSKRFAGVTPAAQMVLALMHTVVATSVVTVLTRSHS